MGVTGGYLPGVRSVLELDGLSLRGPSFAPLGPFLFPLIPMACAMGCILPPLRGRDTAERPALRGYALAWISCQRP